MMAHPTAIAVRRGTPREQGRKPFGRRWGFQRLLLAPWTLRILSLMTVILLWEWYGRRPDSYALVPFTHTIKSLWEMNLSGEIWVLAWGTAQYMLVGFGLAAVVGIASGFLIGLSKVATNTLEPLINALFVAPMTSLVPVIGVWIGLGFTGKMFLVFVFSVFPILINTLTGVRQVDRELLMVARSFGANKLKVCTEVIFPFSLPYVMAGLRMGMGRAVRGAIVADMLLAASQLGRLLVEAGSTFNMSRLIAGILFTTFLGFAAVTVVQMLENKVVHWHRE